MQLYSMSTNISAVWKHPASYIFDNKRNRELFLAEGKKYLMWMSDDLIVRDSE
jgi:hypothetical protein